MTTKEKIICHINYRDVFNAPVSKKNLATWLGAKKNDEELKLFNSVIDEIIEEGLIIERGGYLAVIGREKIIQDQNRKSELTQKILNKGKTGLKFLSMIPFVRFIGVSGSVAAENPTEEYNEKHIDLDLFVVTSPHTLWCFLLAERIFTNLVRLIKGNHFYCLNYVTEESFLEIHNKNFYTATELANLKPIIDKGVYNKLLSNNLWFNKYYDCENISYNKPNNGQSLTGSILLLPFNYFFFVLFGIFRSIKRFDFKGISELKTSFDPSIRCNLKRVSNPNGGYQERVKQKFDELFKSNFNSYWSEEMMEELFPEKDSFQYSPSKNPDDFEINQLFRKYSMQTDEKNSI